MCPDNYALVSLVLPADFPPTIFCNMVKDSEQQGKYDQDVRILEKRGTPVEVIEVRRWG